MPIRELKLTKSITNRESWPVEKYLQEVAKTKRISPEEEVQLAVLIRNGCPKSLNRLVKANLRFVVSVAKKHRGQGLDLGDLINEGNLGLIKAAYRFDETKGFKFISYAVWWIRQHISKALEEQGRTVQLPHHEIKLTNRINRASAELQQKFEREPSPEELAELLDTDLEKISFNLCASLRNLSVDAPDSNDETMLDLLEDPNVERTDDVVDRVESLKKEIDRSLNCLTDREKEVICYYWGIGVDFAMTLDDIGIKFDLTRERIRQIKDKAIKNLRKCQNSDKLRSFLGN